MKKLALLLAFAFMASFGYSQCAVGEIEFVLDLTPDNYPQETSWIVQNQAGDTFIYQPDTIDGTWCLPDTNCYTFTIFDSYGDGICCGYGLGSYFVLVDGDTAINSGGEFGSSESVDFNCPPGSNCSDAVVATEGSWTAPNGDYWYVFTPDSSGIFEITTCGTNTCDTKIWVYDYCQGLVYDNTNIGTIYYDDNSGGCGLQAVVMAQLGIGIPYYIRIGTVNGNCTGAINWSINHNGPITGCTDSLACNYNPLATVSDTCIYSGPGCPDGPDLMVLQDVMETSIYMDQINNVDACMIDEGCIHGYGLRDIMRFTTHIKNIGDQDYFIGDPLGAPTQFNWDNCHGHYHYEGYAEYVMYDSQGQALPIGFKNGFCVMDLECSGGGTFQYGCNNMGISQGCGDIYGAGLNCQWVDITDVADGDYILAIKINWDQSPDALGRYEQGYMNNWAQVCVNISRPGGVPTIALDTANCAPYTDCTGTLFGNAQIDCNGVCGGGALMGDLSMDSLQNTVDASQYVTEILGDYNYPATSCNDLNADNRITVFDAALIASCQHYGGSHQHSGSGGLHNHCSFPYGILNSMDSVYLSIIGVDFTNQYIDIGVRNPNNRVLAYEFNMSGIEMSNVDNLYYPANYPLTVQGDFGGTKVIGISYVDSSFQKNLTTVPLCRIYYNNITASEICIDEIIDVVNENYERTFHFIEGGCIDLTSVADNDNVTMINVAPNPNAGAFKLTYSTMQPQDLDVMVFDPVGKLVYQRTLASTAKGELNIDMGQLSNGLYTLAVKPENGSVISKKIVLLR